MGNFKLKKEIKSNVRFHLVVNIIFLLTITLASYIHIPLKSLKNHFFYFIHMCALQSSFAGILYFLSLNKYLFKTLFSIIYIALGLVAFWVYSIDISISPFLIDASFQTEVELIKDLISIPLLIYVIILFILLFIILKLYSNVKIRFFRVSTLISLCLISIFFIAEKLRPETFQFKLPYQLFFSFYKYINEEPIELENINSLNFNSSLKNNLQVTLIIGESVRADHLGINGYERNTTPNLSKIDKNFISFKNMYTNKSYTSASIPQILSNQSIYDTTDFKIRSIYDVLNKSKINTKWIGNQFLETSYKSIANNNKDVLIIDKFKSYDSYHKSKDEALLPYLNKELKANKVKNMTTLHMVGSHWWYENRYDKRHRKYTPVIDSKYFPSLKKNQIINSYDNTILYLDFFLNQVINQHKKLEIPSIIIYISDHGESLGEEGKWLHAHDSKAVTNPAFMIWYSDNFKQAYPDKINLLSSFPNEKLTTDIIYKLVLDLFKIRQTK